MYTSDITAMGRDILDGMKQAALKSLLQLKDYNA